MQALTLSPEAAEIISKLTKLDCAFGDLQALLQKDHAYYHAALTQSLQEGSPNSLELALIYGAYLASYRLMHKFDPQCIHHLDSDGFNSLNGATNAVRHMGRPL